MRAKWSSFIPLILLLTQATVSQSAQVTDDAVVVALYSDQGCWDDSVRAAENMFQWMGYAVELVNADRINNQGLDGFKILCIPCGDMYQYAKDISSGGQENIKDFIGSGGGYIGICGGAYFASERIIWAGKNIPTAPLGIFPGKAEGIIDEIAPFPHYAMCEVNMVDSTNPITRSEGDSVWMLYYWGPVLTPNEDTDIDILGRYEIGDQPAMVAFYYGQGRVFLIGPAAEIEEDSDRDGNDFADEFDDLGSDWELMKNATKWCLGEL